MSLVDCLSTRTGDKSFKGTDEIMTGSLHVLQQFAAGRPAVKESLGPHLVPLVFGLVICPDEVIIEALLVSYSRISVI